MSGLNSLSTLYDKASTFDDINDLLFYSSAYVSTYTLSTILGRRCMPD